MSGPDGAKAIGRRVRRLLDAIEPLVPPGATVLDLGAGSGLLAATLAARRPDLALRAFDVLLRPGAVFPVEAYDGARLPVADGAVDVVLLVDVLHHCPDPRAVLAEAARVARKAVVLKDHVCEGRLDDATLRFMDWVGNRGSGIEPPHEYWSRDRWARTFAELGLVPEVELRDLGLYPLPFDLVFGRGLHILVRLVPGLSARESPLSG